MVENNMQITPTKIPEVLLIKPVVFEDERGFFLETYQKQKMKAGGIGYEFVQDNHSRSQKGTLRGLHYQIENAQGKLVRVTIGTVLDVAVDLRKSSPTFGQWVGAILSDQNKYQLWVPPGFAHGFYVLSEYADFLYKVTDIYNPQAEHCLLWNDPTVAVDWQIPEGETPILSPKDEKGRLLNDVEVFD